MGLDSRQPFVYAALFAAFSSVLSAQTVRNGRIDGTVSDLSSAVLPGTTVTLTSPSLQVPQLVTTSDSRGEYQFADLPPGLYQITFDLSGFAKVVRDAIRITTGFAARVDVQMQVAAQSETITVSGQSPLVDVTNVRGGGTVTQELLSSVPTNRNYQDTMLLVPGAAVQGPPQVGDIGFRALTGGHVTYGLAADTSNSVEGIEALPNEAPDFASVEEVDVKTYGNTAETSIPGAVIQLIVKSGGNTFHGKYTEQAINQRFNSTNVDDRLRAQGISAGDALVYYYDFSGDLGGRIVRDKLWFYGAYRDSRNERTAPGYIVGSPGPEGLFHTVNNVAGQLPAQNRNETVKISYQATPRNRFIGFFARNPIDEYQSLGSNFIPFPSTLQLNQTARQGKVEWQGALSDRLTAEMMYGTGGYAAGYLLQDDVLTIPSSLDRATGYLTGASFDSRSTITRTPWRHQISGSMNYFPNATGAGSHQITAGYRLWFGRQGLSAPAQQTGDLQLVYDSSLTNSATEVVNGLKYTPVQINFKNMPVDGESRENTYAVYVTDQWRPTKRLTLNLGVRWEREKFWVPAEVKVQGPFGNAGNYDQVDVANWAGLAPRAGLSLDITGNGKTVLKGSYGLYYIDPGVGYAQTWNQNTITTTSYRWTDPTHCLCYVPGSVNLNTNGAAPDFISVAGATNNIVNPDLKWAREHELMTSLERELPGNMSVRGLFLYKRITNQAGTINALRPISAWNIPLTRQDPGPDGVLGTGDDGAAMTIYDYDPAYKGSNFVGNEPFTSDRDDSYTNYEITLNRRKSGKWYAFTSFLGTKNHRWLNFVPSSPNDNLFNIDNTWTFSYRLAAGYEFPYQITVSTLYEYYNGLPGQRTYIFRNLPQSSTLTLPVGPFGEVQGDPRNVVNFRLSKNLKLGSIGRIGLDLDALNLFNTNVAWGTSTGGGNGTSYAEGPTYGYVNRIVSPRNVRFGVSFIF